MQLATHRFLHYSCRHLIAALPSLLAYCIACFPAAMGSRAFSSQTEAYDPGRFVRVSLALGLERPMEFDIAADGNIFLIELAGKVKRIDPRTKTETVIGSLNVTTEQENGLIGLALAPDFMDSGWIYLQYSPPEYSGQRISRFRYDGQQLDLASEQRIFQFEEQRKECCHHAGGMEFGPDGCLYIGTGDNTNPFEDSAGYAPLDQRPGREPWDAQRTSGNSRSFNGKILRILPLPEGGYAIPDGNLFPADGSQGHPEIFVMGCRNPWRLSVDHRTGFLYWGDVGPDAGSDGPRGPRGYDEINQARQAGNFGWPYFVGNNFAYSRFDFETKSVGSLQEAHQPVNESPNNTGVRILPAAQPALIYYPGAAFEPFKELGSGGRTACAGPMFYASDYSSQHPHRMPEHFDRSLFIHEWSRSWIKAVRLDDEHRVQQIVPFLPEWTLTRPIQIKFDRDGVMHVLLYGETWGVNADAELIRLEYHRGNRAPRAVLDLDRDAGAAPLTIQLSADQSNDPDGDPLETNWSYQIETSNPGSSVPPSVELLGNQTHHELTLTQPGVYTVHLDVVDAQGASSRQSANVIVGNDPPKIRFLSPAETDFFDPGGSIDYEVEVVDLEDGTSDYASVNDQSDYDELSPEAAGRVIVQLSTIDPSGNSDGTNEPAGMRLIRGAGCLNCHALNRPLVGPPFLEVAKKYRDQPDQIEQSILRVRNGSTGVWGKVPMLPQSQPTAEELRTMVEHIFSLSEDSAVPFSVGLRNTLTVPPEAAVVQLTASYTDAGNGDLPALTGIAQRLLRPRKIQAEDATEYAGTQPLGSSKADAGRFMGSIQHQGYLRFVGIPFSKVGGIRASVASAGAGGNIEFRAHSPDGPLLGSMPVEVNGDWEQFYLREIDIEANKETADLFLVFVNKKNRSGLMNVDWIELLPAKEPNSLE